tara:strand:- start:205 stop:420 length:216 start_codon:yes stop_codon:yes gene_type:complete
MITKQKRNLINELSFWILQEIELLNNDNELKKYYDNTIHIKTLLNVVKSSKDYTNKQIKELIHDLKFALPL